MNELDSSRIAGQPFMNGGRRWWRWKGDRGEGLVESEVKWKGKGIASADATLARARHKVTQVCSSHGGTKELRGVHRREGLRPRTRR